MPHKTSLLRALVAVAVSVGAVVAVAGIATASTLSGPGTAIVSATATYPAPSTPAPTMSAPPTPTTSPTPTCDECDCPVWSTTSPTSTVGTDFLQPAAYHRAGNVKYTFTITLRRGQPAGIAIAADPEAQRANVRDESVGFNACYALQFSSPIRKDCTLTSITVVPNTIKLESEFVAKNVDDPVLGVYYRYFVKFQNKANPGKEFNGTVTVVVTCPIP